MTQIPYTEPSLLARLRSPGEMVASAAMSVGTFILAAELSEQVTSPSTTFIEAAQQNPQYSVPMGIMAVGSLLMARLSGRHS